MLALAAVREAPRELLETARAGVNARAPKLLPRLWAHQRRALTRQTKPAHVHL